MFILSTLQLFPNLLFQTSHLSSSQTQKISRLTFRGRDVEVTKVWGHKTNMTISDCIAAGGATWNAFTDQGNVDAGNVDGWDFGISPVVGATEYTYRIRSFTQPRRF